MLPKYVIDHYFYLRAKEPDIVPSIEFIDDNFNSSEFLLANQTLDINSNEVTEFFQSLIKNLKLANEIDNDEYKLNLYKSIINDLNHLSQIEQDYSASCEIMYSFIKCLIIIKEQEQQNDINLVKLDEVSDFPQPTALSPPSTWYFYLFLPAYKIIISIFILRHFY